MHKLSLYLNDNQYEKLKILQGNSCYASPEECANEFFYSALFARWCKYKADALDEMLKTGNIEEETKRITLNDTEYEIWCDGEFAVITADDKDTCSYQLIDGDLHYVLLNGTRIHCSQENAKEIEKVLEKAGYKLKDFAAAELDRELLLL